MINFFNRAKKNLQHFETVYSAIIDDMESDIDDNCPSCKDVMLRALTPYLERSKDQAKKWTASFDYVTMAHKMIYNISFNLLSSGEFHIWRGELNPLNESSHLLVVCIKCLDWYQEHGIVDAKMRKEQELILFENIDNAG